MREKEDGFTMIEMMVVIAIILVVSAIAIPSYISYRNNDQTNRLKADMLNAATVINSQAGGIPAVYPDVLPNSISATDGTTFGYSTPNELTQYCLTGERDGVTMSYASASQGFVASCSFTNSTELTARFVEISRDPIQTTGYYEWNAIPGAVTYELLQTTTGKTTTASGETKTWSLETERTDAASNQRDFEGLGRPSLRSFEFSWKNQLSGPDRYVVRALDRTGAEISRSATISNASWDKLLTANVTTTPSLSVPASTGSPEKYFVRDIDWSAFRTSSDYGKTKEFVIASGDLSKGYDSLRKLATIPNGTTTYRMTDRMDDVDMHFDTVKANPVMIFAITDRNNDKKNEVLYLSADGVNPYYVPSATELIQRNAPSVTFTGYIYRNSVKIATYRSSNSSLATMNTKYETPSQMSCIRSDGSGDWTFTVPANYSGIELTTGRYSSCNFYSKFLPTGKLYPYLPADSVNFSQAQLNG